MDELTALSLTNAKLTGRRLTDLIQGARTASIRTLDASGNTLNTAGALQTLQATFPHLTTLTLRRNDLHDERAFDVAPLARLQLLDLSENPLTADTLRGLWFTQALGHVHTLLLAKAGLDETHAHGFAHIAAHGMPALRHLDLSGNS
ncbi:MAG: hypothetical protein AAFX99_33330, partial [Myxococcota bacterium]